MKAHYRAAIDWIQTVPLSGATEGERLRKLAEMDLRHALNSDEHKRWAEAHFAPTELVERWKGERIPDWQSVMYQRATVAVLCDSADAVTVVAGFREVARSCLDESIAARMGDEGEEQEAGRIPPDPRLLECLHEIFQERTQEFRIRAVMDGAKYPHRLTMSRVAKMIGMSRNYLHWALRTGNPKRTVMMGIARCLGWSLAKLESELEKKCTEVLDSNSDMC